jgi:hypothetical protein
MPVLRLVPEAQVDFVKIQEGTSMGHSDRLRLVARATYYLGWIALLLGGLIHFNIGKSMFVALNLSKRNLFEISLVLFIICMASGVRALIAEGNVVPVAANSRKQVAA